MIKYDNQLKIDPSSIDITKIYSNKVDAIGGSNAVYISQFNSSWKSENLTYVENEDGSVLILNDGIPIGWTTKDALKLDSSASTQEETTTAETASESESETQTNSETAPTHDSNGNALNTIENKNHRVNIDPNTGKTIVTDELKITSPDGKVKYETLVYDQDNPNQPISKIDVSVDQFGNSLVENGTKNSVVVKNANGKFETVMSYDYTNLSKANVLESGVYKNVVARDSNNVPVNIINTNGANGAPFWDASTNTLLTSYDSNGYHYELISNNLGTNEIVYEALPIIVVNS